MIVAGTGSRSLATDPMKFQLAVLDAVKWLLANELKPSLVISGGAEGFDSLLAYAARSLNIPYDLYLPNPTYGVYYWRDHSVTNKDRYSTFLRMVEGAHNVNYVCKTVYQDGIHSNFHRNGAMVLNADHFLVFRPESGGTKHCFKLIKEAGLEYDILNSEYSDYDL